MKNVIYSSFGHSISIINRAAASYFTRWLKPLRLGPGQQAYLLALKEGESIPQEELAKRLKVDKANASRAVQGLEKLGYISRTPSSKDSRVIEIGLTDLGISAKKETESIAAQWIEQLKTSVSEKEWQQVKLILSKIAATLHT